MIMTYMTILYILIPAVSLNAFIYMSSYSTVESGDDPYSSRITPDTSFDFGNSYVSSVYVSIYVIRGILLSLNRCYLHLAGINQWIFFDGTNTRSLLTR